jgi:hypothetical protein
MQTITVKDVLDNTLPESGWEKYRIYVFRDGDFILYVGKTDQNIIDRLEEHLGLTFRDSSLIGKLVEDNAPLSYSWHIDLMTLENCESIVHRHFPTCQMFDSRIAEKALIWEYSPALNRESNPNPRPLPHKYTFKREAHILQIYRKVFNDKR